MKSLFCDFDTGIVVWMNSNIHDFLDELRPYSVPSKEFKKFTTLFPLMILVSPTVSIFETRTLGSCRERSSTLSSKDIHPKLWMKPLVGVSGSPRVVRCSRWVSTRRASNGSTWWIHARRWLLISLEFIYQVSFVTGMRGSGKSWTAGVLMEEFERLGLQFVCFDPLDAHGHLST